MTGLPRHKHPYNRTYTSMVCRCENPASNRYAIYGARGVRVCSRWRKRKEGFWNFVVDMGERPEGFTLDRIDSDGDYEPSNCRWADRFQQARNRKTNRVISYKGKTQTLVEWSEELGIELTILTSRLYNGWTEHRALSTKVIKRSRR